MPVAWQLTRWWDCYISENEERQIKPFLTDKK